MTLYTRPPRTFEDVTRPLPPDIQTLCQSVRSRIHSALPEADEGVYGGKAVATVLYSVRGENNVVCGFQPATSHVKVFFHYWQILSDKGLKISGSGKHARHIKLLPDDTQLSQLPQYIAWVYASSKDVS